LAGAGKTLVGSGKTFWNLVIPGSYSTSGGTIGRSLVIPGTFTVAGTQLINNPNTLNLTGVLNGSISYGATAVVTTSTGGIFNASLSVDLCNGNRSLPAR